MLPVLRGETKGLLQGKWWETQGNFQEMIGSGPAFELFLHARHMAELLKLQVQLFLCY